MNKKTLIVPASLAGTIADSLNEQDVWDTFEMVIVRDEEYDNAVENVRASVPLGKRVQECVNYVDVTTDDGSITRVHLLAD